jgi:hypothetical protein
MAERVPLPRPHPFDFYWDPVRQGLDEGVMSYESYDEPPLPGEHRINRVAPPVRETPPTAPEVPGSYPHMPQDRFSMLLRMFPWLT